MYFSSILLNAVEQALPPYGAGIPAKDVYDRVDGYGDTTIRHALRELIDRGRVTYTGPDKHRLYSLPQLPALARASEGPAATPGKSSLNCALGGSPPKVTPSASFSEEPTAQDIRLCVAEGMSDQQIADCFGKSKSWALNTRRKYNIEPAIHRGYHYVSGGPAFGLAPGDAAHAARYAAFFALHGEYKSFSDRQINNYEIAYTATRAQRRTVDVMPVLYGDPSPDRARV